MSQNEQQQADIGQLRPGARGLVILLGQRFLTSILELGPDSVRVSFPRQSIVSDGMRAQLEILDENGSALYETEVLRAPRDVGDGLLLRRPNLAQHTWHRNHWRVPVELAVSFKEHVHPRRQSGDILNLSAGGLLLESRADMEVGSSLDLQFRVPPQHEISALGRVVFAGDSVGGTSAVRRYGIHFVGMAPDEQRVLQDYVWRRLRELNPSSFARR